MAADWAIDDPCEVRLGQRWHGAIIVGIETTGQPRAKILGLGKLVRPGPGKIRRPSPGVTKRLPNITGSWATLGTVLAREEKVARERPFTPQPKDPPARAPSFLDLVRTMPCASCRRPGPSEAHHFTTGGTSMKGSDYFVAPQCRDCHGYNVRDRGEARYPGMTHEESVLLLWKSAAKSMALYIEGARRRT